MILVLEDGGETERYLYGMGDNEVLAQENVAGEVLWVIVDNEGSVRDLVDGNGVVLNHLVYDSFGNIVSESDASVEFRFAYTGQELDGETGLYYYDARYYDSGVGRFISVDPIGFDGGDSNLYRYVFNSPTNFIDPTGTLIPPSPSETPVKIPIPFRIPPFIIPVKIPIPIRIPPAARRLIPAIIIAIPIVIWQQEPTAQPWRSESNPLTKQPYKNQGEYNRVQQQIRNSNSINNPTPSGNRAPNRSANRKPEEEEIKIYDPNQCAGKEPKKCQKNYKSSVPCNTLQNQNLPDDEKLPNGGYIYTSEDNAKRALLNLRESNGFINPPWRRAKIEESDQEALKAYKCQKKGAPPDNQIAKHYNVINLDKRSRNTRDVSLGSIGSCLCCDPIEDRPKRLFIVLNIKNDKGDTVETKM